MLHVLSLSKMAELVADQTSSRSRRKRASGQGVRLKSQTKDIVLNVHKYFGKQEAKAKRRGKGAFEKTLEATGLCRVGVAITRQLVL